MLQIINQIVKDNADFQENACLIGLVSIVNVLAFMFFCWKIIRKMPFARSLLRVYVRLLAFQKQSNGLESTLECRANCFESGSIQPILVLTKWVFIPYFCWKKGKDV